jgi:arylsulfatase
MATLVDIADAEYPDRFRGQSVHPMQGVSLYPVFRGTDLPARDKPLFWQWRNGYAVRSGKWKAVCRRGGKWELFDMSNDLSETNDLSSKFTEKLDELKQRYHQWYASTPAAK